MAMGQKEAVWKAITSVLGTDQFTEAVKLSREDREKVQGQLIEQFRAGEINFSSDLPEEKRLKSYVSGLVSNWLRKDARLNGNTTYTPKAPGSRAGNGDEMLKAMKALRQGLTDQKAIAEIDAEIEKRKAELAKNKQPTVDVNALPEHLRKYAQTH